MLVHDGKERVLYLYKASSYLGICRNDRHLQIGCYQAHAIGFCVERLTPKVDVRTIRVRYPVPTHEGSQGVSVGGSYCKKDQY
jgi:hypothetical protein